MTHVHNKAFPKLRDKKIGGKSKETSKKAKIIVRNLPFKNLTEKTLEDLFREFGKIEEVKLLRKSDGKLKGCGFVQFQKVSSAAKAINALNQKEMRGRKIILDWALPKDTYIEKVKKFQEEHEMQQKVKTTSINSGEKDCEEDKINAFVDKKPDTWASESENEDDANDDNSSNTSTDANENEFGKVIKNKKRQYFGEKEVENSGKKIMGKNKNKSNGVKKTDRPGDAEDGKTLFIRNVPFSATNNDLKKCVENYGPVEYALICIDKLTEHSKGTAFVKFKNEESASHCIKDSNKLLIHESPLNITYALTKEHLENKKTNKKTMKDSRNLYLVREGVVPAGSKAATGVSASDMSKRLKLEQWKSQILKNLNMFVSRTRLVVHNLPANYDDQKLRQLFLKYSNSDAVIKESKVMWEKNKLDAMGKHISKEVGFVSFTKHEDALFALRNINNNPNIFSPNKRPIVAFSIENRAVINQKIKRIEKSRAKLGVTIDEKMSKLNRKQRRFLRRRQKIIEQRREAKKEKIPQAETSVQTNKRKASGSIADRDGNPAAKKTKLETKRLLEPEGEFKFFTGITSEPGLKVKLRSRFNLKKQALLHAQTLKKEKAKRKMKNGKKRIEPLKQPKQKRGTGKSLLDDAKLSRLIARHREDIKNSSRGKKWYDS